MKRHRASHSLLLAAAAGMIAGCASFDHQTAVTEPHGTIELWSPGDRTPPYREAYAFDGVRVRSSRGKRFRVKPGLHELVSKDVVPTVREGQPISLTLSSSDADPFPSRRTVDMYPDRPPELSDYAPLPLANSEMINARWHGWATSYITNTLTVIAGEHYVLDGYGFRQSGGKQKAARTTPTAAEKKRPAVRRRTVTTTDKERAIDLVKQANGHFLKNKHDAAITSCTRAIRLNPYAHGPYCTRGRAYCAKGLFDDAIADLGDAIRLKGSCHDAYCGRGQAYYCKKGYQRAVDDATEAIRLRPGCLSSLLTRARARGGLDQFDAALEDYSEVLRVKPDRAETYFERGVAYLRLFRFKEGTEDLRQCVTLNPKWKDRVQPFINRYGGDRNVSPPLHGSVITGAVASATQLLDAGANVNSLDGKGRTPLHLAIYRRRPDMVSLLLERGADSAAVERTSGCTPLDIAAGLDFTEIVTLLLKHLPNSEEAPAAGVAALHMACGLGAAKTAEVLLENGVPVDTRRNGATALMVAVMLGNQSMAKVLVSYGADCKAVNAAGNTILYILSGIDWAQTNRSAVLARASLLGLKKKAEQDGSILPDSTEKMVGTISDVITRLSTNVVTDYRGCAELLLAKGAEVDAQNPRGMTPLINAAMGGNLEGVRFLIEHEADVGHRDKAGFSALESACEADLNGVEIVKLLLSKRSDTRGSTKDGSSALHVSASQGRLDVMRILLDRDSGTEVKERNGLTPLHYAAGYGRPEAVRLLLDHAASVDARGAPLTKFSGDTPLVNALKMRHVRLTQTGTTSAGRAGWKMPRLGDADHYRQVAELLIDAGANIDARARNGMSALLYAADMADPVMVKLLLDHEADIHARLEDGQGPLNLAASRGNLEVMTLLIDGGADVDRPGQNKGTPLHVATFWDHADVVSLLLEEGADPNRFDASGQTPLHVAFMTGNASIVRMLAKCGADLNAALQGFPCLHLACALGRRRVVEQLLAARVDTSTRAPGGMTPLACTFLAEVDESECSDQLVRLHEARGRRLVIPPCDRTGVARLLIDAGAGILINVRDKQGRTALHGAAERGETASVELLLKQGAVAALQDKTGSTPLDLATVGGHEGVVKLLLDTESAR